MKTSISLEHKNEKVLYGLLFSAVLSTYFQKYFIYIGFAFKPYMITLVLIMLAYLLLNLKLLLKLFFYEKMFIMFVIYSFIRGLFSQDFSMFSRMAANLSLVCLLYFFISNLVYRLDKKLVISILYKTGMIFLGVSLTLYILDNHDSQLGGIYEGALYRLTGTIVDPNIFGIFVSLIYGLSLYGISKHSKRFYLSLALSVITIVLTFSRGAILGILFCSVVLSITLKLFTINRLINTIIIILVLAFGFLIVQDEIILRKMGLDILQIAEMRMGDLSGTGRLSIWKNGINLFNSNPIFGVGLYNFQYHNIKIFYDDHYMHNTFLEVFVENGLIGGFFFLNSIIAFILIKNRNDEEKVIKKVVYTQLFMLLFLTGIANEFIYLTLGIYKGFQMKCSNELYQGGVNG